MAARKKYVGLYEVSMKRVGRVCETPNVGAPTDALPVITSLIANKAQEHFILVALDARNNVAGAHVVSIGSLSASIVHPREVFGPAIELRAASIIIAHNHPSGDVTPSREDIELTKRLVQAGEIMGIEVLDHIIIGNEYMSLRERGMM